MMNFLGASIVLLDHRSRLITQLIEIEDRVLERVESRIL